MEHEALITGYFEGTLTAEQQRAFDRLLVEDAGFAQEVEFQREVRQAITLDQRAQLKQLLRDHEQHNKPTLRMRWWIGAAAAVLLVVGGGTFLWHRASSARVLYAEYYQTYPNTVMPTVRGEQPGFLEQQAFRAYDNADYANAEKLFGDLYRQSGEDYALLYRGVSLLELGRFTTADSVLSGYPAEGSLYVYARWYRALSLLRLGKRDESRELLAELADGQTPVSQEAQQLLNRL